MASKNALNLHISMLKIGLTGGIGSGKQRLLSFLSNGVLPWLILILLRIH